MIDSDDCINVKGITFAYQGKNLLQNLSFSVKKGDVVSFIGRSGSGKTTLFRLLSSLEKADQGTIEICGKISYMTQYPLLLPRRTIFENLMLLYELHSSLYSTKEDFKQQALSYLKEVGLLDVKDAYPHMLSGGMQSRAVFARILLENRPILLLDEPFAFLDAITRYEMHVLVQKLCEKYQKTMLLVTHDILEAVRLSNRVYLLSSGNLKKVWDIPKDTSLHENLIAEIFNALQAC